MKMVGERDGGRVEIGGRREWGERAENGRVKGCKLWVKGMGERVDDGGMVRERDGGKG